MGAASDEKAVLKAEYTQAQECRSYSEVAVSAVPSTVGDKFSRYWVTESERIGAQLGLSKDTIYFDYLMIKVDVEQVKPIWLKCFDLTPKKILESP